MIDQGRKSGDQDAIWAGNLRFAFREQREVVNPGYEMLNQIWIAGVPLVSVMSFMAESPVPAGLPFWRVAERPPNLAGFYGQRWKWITDDMWPKWRALEQNERLELTARSLDEMVEQYTSW